MQLQEIQAIDLKITQTGFSRLDNVLTREGVLDRPEGRPAQVPGGNLCGNIDRLGDRFSEKPANQALTVALPINQSGVQKVEAQIRSQVK